MYLDVETAVKRIKELEQELEDWKKRQKYWIKLYYKEKKQLARHRDAIKLYCSDCTYVTKIDECDTECPLKELKEFESEGDK